MENIVYTILILMLMILWVWSKYLQRDLINNRVSLKVGEWLSWVIFLEGILGVILIFLSNILHVESWKVFFMIISYMGVGVIITWLMASWTLAYVGHKIPAEYQIQNKARENRHFIVSLIVIIGVIVSQVIAWDIQYSILLYITLPIIVIIERVFIVKKLIREFNQYEPYTEEEARLSQERLEQAIKEGKVLKPKDNFFTKQILREKGWHLKNRQQEKVNNASQSMEDIKKRNDALEDNKKKGDDE